MRAPEADFEVSRISWLGVTIAAFVFTTVAAWLVTVEFLTRLA